MVFCVVRDIFIYFLPSGQLLDISFKGHILSPGGNLGRFVSFAVLDRGEEESFEGDREASVFVVARTDVRANVFEFICLEILSVLEFIKYLKPCKRTPCSTSFLKSSFIVFKMGFILVLYSLQFSLRIFGTSL